MSRRRRSIAFLVAVSTIAVGFAVAPPEPVAAGPARPASPGAGATIQGAVFGDGAAGYVGVVPERLFDTRESTPLAAGEVREVTVAGMAGVPATGVDAVVLNVTVASSTAGGWLTLFPAGAEQPTASNLNFVSGQTVANLVIAKLGEDGAVAVYNKRGDTHVVLDVQGWFATGQGYTPLVPERILDTRDTSPVGSGESIDLRVLGEGGVPSDGVDSVVLNVTVTRPSQAGWLTVFPAGTAPPLASNLNFLADQTVANLVVAKVGVDGEVSLRNERGAAEVVVDVQGWFAPDEGYTALTPARVLDTRETQAVGPGETLEVQVAGEGGVPADGVDAVVLNVTAARSSAAGWLTVFPAGVDSPLASNLNFVAGRAVPNVVIAKVGDDGKVSIRNERGDTQVVVDVQGWFGDGAALTEGDDVGWRFVPRHVLLAPGESSVVELVQTDADGAETGSSLPPGVAFATSTDAGVVTVTPLSGRQVLVTAGPEIDTALVGAEIPGWPVNPALTVTIARLQPDVLALPDEQVLFPTTDLPPGVPEGDWLPDGVTEAGPGPFTWDEFADRFERPADALAGDMPWDDVFAATFHYPVVLQCPAPVPGTLVVASGASGVMGQVIEPSGLPTLERDGWCLVTVEIVAPQDIYDDLHYDLSYDELLALGMVPPIPTYTTEDLPYEPDPFATEGASRPGRRAESDPGNPTPDPVGSQTASTASQSSPQQGGGFTDKARQCRDAMKASAGVAGQALEIQPAIASTFTPIFEVLVDIDNGTPADLKLRVGASLSMTVQLKAKVQSSLTLEATCPLASILEMRIAGPGPLAPFIDFYGRGDVSAKLTIKADGGPRLEAGFGCTAGVVVAVGFAYNGGSDALTSLNEFTPSSSCQPVWNLASGLTADGAGVSIEIAPGVAITSPLGLRLGGVVVGAIGAVLHRFNPAIPAEPGVMQVIKGEMGPTLKAVWENVSNAIANQSAKSGVSAELGTKIFVEFKPIMWFLGKFKLTKQPGTVVPGVGESSGEIPLFTTTVPIGSLYAPLNNVRFEATVGGDDAPSSPAVYVQEDDELTLLSVLAPTIAGLTNPLTPQLTEGWLYRGDGALWEQSDFFGAVSVAQATGVEAVHGNTALRVQSTITEGMCDAMRDEPLTFRFAGNAPIELIVIDIPAAAWGGEFKIQCVDGSVRWEPEQVLDIPQDGSTSVSLFTKGASADSVEITGVPEWLDWEGGTTHVLTPKADGEDELEFTMTVNNHGNDPTCPQRQATIVATTEHRGVKNLTVMEDEKCYVRFEPNDLTGPGSVSAQMTTEGFGNLDIPVQAIEQDLPDWLHLVTPGADHPVENPTVLRVPASDGAPQPVDWAFEIDEREPLCVDQPPRVHIIQITSDRGNATLTLKDPSVPKRDDCGLKFTPTKLPGHGVSQLSIRADALVEDGSEAEWTIPWSPEWMTVSPTSGTLTQGASSPVLFAGSPPAPPACARRAPLSIPIDAEASLPDGSTLTATVILEYPAVEPSGDCTPNPAGAWGDPHMFSFDGVTWEGQTIGEYVYTESLPGAAVPFRVVARHEPTSVAARSTSVAPTSVTAAHFTYGGHSVEVYSSSAVTEDAPWTVYIDGVGVELADGVPVSVGDGLSVVRTGLAVRADAPGLFVNATLGSILNLTVTLLGSPAVRGLLGDPDGNVADEFTGSDGTVYLASDIQGWAQPQFNDFNSSWRILDQDLSPFTVQLPAERFGLPSPGFDADFMAEWADEVEVLLDAVSPVCAGVDTVGFRTRFAIALELLIGSPTSVIESYLCRYTVHGVASVDGQPVPGLAVTVDGVGVQQCTTTTAIDGTYQCMVAPSSVEAAGVTPSLPLELDVVGTWPGRPGVAVTATASFAALAFIEDGPSVAEVPLLLDDSSMPVAHVSGVVLRDGEPVGGDRTFTVVARDGTGLQLAQFQLAAAVDPATGEYSFTRPLPGATVTADISTTIATPVVEHFSAQFDELELGANAMEFDVDYAVPTLAVAGTATDGSAGLASATVTVDATDASGAVIATTSVPVTPDPISGAYRTVIALPRGATDAVARMLLPPYGEAYFAPEVPIVPGANEVALDVVHNPPVVTLQGVMVDDTGAPLAGPITVAMTFYSGSGGVLAAHFPVVSPQPGDGSYSITRATPLGTATVRATVVAGASGEQFSVGPVAVPNGPSTLVLDVNLAPVRLQVTGTMLDGVGAPLAGPISVRAWFYTAGGSYLGQHVVAVTPGAGGAYTADFVGHRDAARAEVGAIIGVPGETYDLSVSGLAPGDHSATLDVVHHPPLLTLEGNMINTATGEALPSPVTVGVQFRNGGGPVYGTTVQVNPSPGTGAFSVTVPGHHTATAALVVAYVGQNGETVEADVPLLVPGANTLPFNVGFAAPIVTLSGTMLQTGGIPTGSGAYVRLQALDSDGAEIWYQRVFVGIGSEGQYSLTRTLPEEAVTLVATAEVGVSFSDWKSTGAVAVVPGNQTVPFDVLWQPVQLQVNGSMTSAPGVPLPGTIPVGVSAKDAEGNLIRYVQPDVQPAAGTGDYSFTVTLAEATDSVELIAFIGQYGFEQEKLTVTGFSPGTLTTATFDVVHNPPTLQVGGVAQVNGELVNGQVEIRLEMLQPEFGEPLQRTYYASAVDGVYSQLVVLAEDTYQATVKVRALSGANTFTSAQNDIVPNEVRTVTIDFNDVPDSLDLSGTMLQFGEPASSANLSYTFRDASDNTLASGVRTVALGPDGSYATSIAMPNGTVRADVTAVVVGGGETHFDHRSLTGLSSGANPVILDVDSIRLELTGTLLDAGVPVVLAEPSGTLHFEVLVDRGSAGLWGYSSDGWYNPETGEYGFQLTIPVPSVSATVSITGVASPDPSYTFSGLAGGVFSDTWNVDISDTALPMLTVEGTLTNGLLEEGMGYGFGEMDAQIEFWQVLPENAASAEPYSQLSSSSTTVTPDDVTGAWSAAELIPEGANVATVSLWVDGPSEPPVVRTYVLAADGEHETVTWAFDMQPSRVSFDILVSTDASCVTPTLVATYELWAFAEAPADENGDPNTWPGGQYLGEFTVVPDPVTHQAWLVVQVPADATYLRVHGRSADLYTMGPFNSSFGYSLTLAPDSFHGTGDEAVFSCG